MLPPNLKTKPSIAAFRYDRTYLATEGLSPRIIEVVNCHVWSI